MVPPQPVLALQGNAGYGGTRKALGLGMLKHQVQFKNSLQSTISGKLTYSTKDAQTQAGEMWAIALSENGQYLAATSYDGKINVWDCLGERKKIREYETKGSFGLCIDLV